jgi:transcriptional regulator with XRE-family HTH domain
MQSGGVTECRALTQQELADRIDVEVMQVSRIERGTVNTSICMIKEIADNLNIQLSELFSSFEQN